MKFGVLLSQVSVPEWKDAYMNYELLKTCLSPGKLMIRFFVKTQFKNGSEQMIVIHSKNEDFDELIVFYTDFETLLIQEFEKINAFFHFKLMDCYLKWRYLRKNTEMMHENRISQNFFEMSSQLRMSYHLFWKEINLLKEYVNINNQGFTKITKQHNKQLKIFMDKI